MSQYILSFDPGKSTGVALGAVDEDNPYWLIQAWQFEDGPRGLIEWLVAHAGEIGDYAVISEKFVPLNGQPFGQTLDSTIPLVCEGVLLATGVMPDYPDPRWRRASTMYLYGGSDRPEKLKRARAYLKDRGMLQTGKMVGCKDANDANSAILHGISYAAQVLHHRKTFDSITEWAAHD